LNKVLESKAAESLNPPALTMETRRFIRTQINPLLV